MAQTTKGIRAVLSVPQVYSLFSRLITGGANNRTYVDDYVRARSGDRILDIGCGPADILGQLPRAVRYDGFDLSESYIERARTRWGDRGTFHCARVDENSVEENAYDLVLATAVLHHLDDDEALALFRLAHRALKPGGRVVTFDGCYVPGQSLVARYLLSKDRGCNVRDENGYAALARHVFPSVVTHIRHDLLRIPYTHIIMECEKTPS